MTAPTDADHTRAIETLTAIYRLLADIGRRHRESKHDDSNEEQPADEQAA